ncbi:hypothetical protein GCM10027343_22040 [Noviherbaspirillum agri]
MRSTINSQSAAGKAWQIAALLALLGTPAVQAATPEKATAKPAMPAKAAEVHATPRAPVPTDIAPPLQLAAGKSSILRAQHDISRISVGNPDTADVVLLNSREVYVLGKKTGSTNIFLWSKGGRTTVIDVSVGADTAGLKGRLNQLLPGEKGIMVDAAGDAIVLSGNVSDAVKAQRAVLLAEQFGGKKVVNMLSTGDVPQVMLEVKVAEVSKTLIDKLGAQFSGTRHNGNFTYSLLTGLLSKASGALTIAEGATNLTLDAEIRNGLVKVLAEPTIMAISGQEGAFLAGGKIFIPVSQSNALGGTTITLEEKEFGVGLKFTPTVLDEGRINLRVTPEVSELTQVGSPFMTVNGVTSILPSITTRRASTTVQLMDGQSFAIGGLIKNNVNEAVKAFPILGEVPVLGALFRSSEFQNDRTELLFIVTPRLVKPLEANYALPTDNFVEPSRSEFLLLGRTEGKPATEENTSEQKPAPSGAAVSTQRGFEVK